MFIFMLLGLFGVFLAEFGADLIKLLVRNEKVLRLDKALHDAASLTQINQIKELQHSML